MSGIADSAKSLFGPDTPVKERDEERLQLRRDHYAKASKPPLLKNGYGTEAQHTRPPRSKRKRRPPMDVADVQKCLDERAKKTGCRDMAEAARKRRKEGVGRDDDRARCCREWCVKRFADSDPSHVSFNAWVLKSEQDDMRKREREVQRKAFVSERVPPRKLARGSMMAANSPVCNTAFTLLFGVTETLISNVKGAAGARASISVTRSGTSATVDHKKKDRDLYDIYYNEERSFFTNDPVDMRTYVCSRDYFFKVWQDHLPHTKLKHDSDFMHCSICTLLKERLHGTPGSKSNQTEAQKAETMRRYRDHLKLMELVDEWNEPIGDLVVQLDNTVAENKNNILTGMAAALVDAGVIRTVTLVFMMVGHTHNEIDQVFFGVKGRNVFTRQELGEVFAAAYTALPVRTRTLENQGNFKALFNGAVRKVPGISQFQALRVVDPEIIWQIGIRQAASWSRVAAAFPGHTEKEQEVKQQHAESLRILRETGDRPFDLRTDWLHRWDDDRTHDGLDGDEDDHASAGGSPEDDQEEEEEEEEDNSDDDNFYDYGAGGPRRRTSGDARHDSQRRPEIPASIKEILRDERNSATGDSATGERIVGGTADSRVPARVHRTANQQEERFETRRVGSGKGKGRRGRTQERDLEEEEGEEENDEIEEAYEETRTRDDEQQQHGDDHEEQQLGRGAGTVGGRCEGLVVGLDGELLQQQQQTAPGVRGPENSGWNVDAQQHTIDGQPGNAAGVNNQNSAKPQRHRGGGWGERRAQEEEARPNDDDQAGGRQQPPVAGRVSARGHIPKRAWTDMSTVRQLVATFKPKPDMMFNGIAAWKALVKKYRNPSRQRQTILFKKLYNMTMDVEQDPDAFMHDMTEQRDKLQLLGSPIPDDQFLNIILDCLPEQLYSGIKYEAETREDHTLEQALYTMRNIYINRKEQSGTSSATKGRGCQQHGRHQGHRNQGNRFINGDQQRGQNRNGYNSFNSNAPAGQHQHNSNDQANYGQAPATPSSTLMVDYYNPAGQQVPGSATTALAAPAPPSGVGFSFVANSTAPAPTFTMTVDTGASNHLLDSELLPDLEQRMIECTKIDPPLRITVAGQGQLAGTAKRVLKVIVTVQHGDSHPIRLPFICVPDLGRHLFSGGTARKQGVSTFIGPTSFLDLVSTDLLGPVSPTAIGGFNYMAKFTDHASRLKAVFFIAKKNDALASLVNFVQDIAIPLGLRVEYLRSDNGGEFVNSKFRHYCKTTGIIQQFSSPHTPQQNGISERDEHGPDSPDVDNINDGITLLEQDENRVSNKPEPAAMISSRLRSSGHVPLPQPGSSNARQARELRQLNLASQDHPQQMMDSYTEYIGTVGLDSVLPPAAVEVPNTFKQAMNSPQSAQWDEAMRKELSSLQDHDVADLIPISSVPAGCSIIGTPGVYRVKTDGRFKARVVVQGWAQQHGIDCFTTFAPVCRTGSQRLLLAIAAAQGWLVLAMDLQTAFLNGTLSEDVYTYQAPGFKQLDGNGQPLVWKLKKSLYGLRQSPSVWNLTMDKDLRRKGYTPTASDPCVYTKGSGNSYVMLTLFVDDILLTGPSNTVLQEARQDLQRSFAMTDLGPASQILGIEIKQDLKKDIITLSQEKYTLSILKRFKMDSCKPSHTPGTGVDNKASTATNTLLSDADKKEYQRLHPGVDITYRRDAKFELTLSSDASYAQAPGYKSTTGSMAFSSGGLVHLNSQTQRILAQSTSEAEIIAVNTTAKQGVYLTNIMGELGWRRLRAFHLLTDNRSALSLVTNGAFSSRSKHIAVRYNALREWAKENHFRLDFMPSESMLADICTKHCGRDIFHSLIKQVQLHH
eukprot:g16510.t1